MPFEIPFYAGRKVNKKSFIYPTHPYVLQFFIITKLKYN